MVNAVWMQLAQHTPQRCWKVLTYFMSMDVSSVSMSVHAWYLKKQEKDGKSPRTWVTARCEHPVGAGNWTRAHLEEQPVLFTIEPSLQLKWVGCILYSSFFYTSLICLFNTYSCLKKREKKTDLKTSFCNSHHLAWPLLVTVKVSVSLFPSPRPTGVAPDTFQFCSPHLLSHPGYSLALPWHLLPLPYNEDHLLGAYRWLQQAVAYPIFPASPLVPG